MKKEHIDYLRAEVSRAQKEGATSVLVRIPEMHSLLAQLAELEKRKAEEPKGTWRFAGYVNLGELESMRAGHSYTVRVSRGKRKNMDHPVYYTPETKS